MNWNYNLGLGGTVFATIAVVLGGALLWTRVRLGRLHQEMASVRAEVARSEAQAKEQSRTMSRLRSDRGSVATLAMQLPHVLQALNRSNLEPRRVPILILNLLDAIFQPGHALFYVTRSTGVSTETTRELHLIQHPGLNDVPAALKRVRFGQGKIGWVAEHRIDMLKEDWLNPMRTEGQRVEDNHPAVAYDIVGPIVYHDDHGEHTLGVLCVGSLGVRPRDEKSMFQLVTNLCAMALINAENVMRLRERANTDGLTGLLNKRYFTDEKLSVLIFTAEREAQPVALFIFDIDHFKSYNYTNGHPASDELLRSLAALLRQNLRPGDLCCRYGGEEFVVAMPETDGDEALRVAERLRAAIDGHPFPHQEKQPGGNVTISGGVAVYPEDAPNAAELTTNADIALYEAKRSGRNRVLRYRGVNIGDAEDATGFDLLPATDEEVKA